MKKRKLKSSVKFALIILIGIVLCMGGFILKKEVLDKKKTEPKKETKKEEKIKYSSPVLKLKGRDPYKVVVNGVYEEYGVFVTDEYDTDLEDKVKIDNKIDISKPGEYVVKYSVTNSKGATGTIERKVSVIDVTEPDTDGIAVFMYHYFFDDTAGETGPDSNHLEKSLFEEQLKYLSENDYYFPNFKELRKYVDGELTLPEKSCVITMDDGHADNYTIAYPLAVKYKVPITMFVVTSWTDVTQNLQKEMFDTGYVYFMSHTDEMHEGTLITSIDYETGVNDLKTSASKLGKGKGLTYENEFNGDALAYPTGANNDNSYPIVRDAGFKLAFTVDYGHVHPGDDPLTLPRVRISQGNDLDYFKGGL